MKNPSNSYLLRFFRWFCHPDYVDDIEGDLLERHASRAAKHGQRYAHRKLRRDVIQLFRPGIIRPIKQSQKLNFISMFKHNLLISLRSFKRFKGTFIINLFGLSTGLASAILIYLWVFDDLNTDVFNEVDSHRHVQVIHTYPTSGTYHTNSNGSTPNPLFERLPKDLPEIEYSFPVKSHINYVGVASSGDSHMRARYQFIGKGYFNVFPGDFIHGNKHEILTDKNEIAISKNLALTLFSSTEKAIGQLIEFKDEGYGGSYLVSGVFKPTQNMSNEYDVLFSYELFRDADLMQWYNGGTQAHLVLKEDVDLAAFNEKMYSYLSTLADNWKDILYAQPYSEKYLYGKYVNGLPTDGKIIYVRLFSLIGLFILAIACINYMNFSTANAARRIKEIGVKKAIGAKRKNLLSQFISESVFLVFISLILSCLIAYLLLPEFNHITGKGLVLSFDLSLITAIITIACATGILSGLYPALLLSGFNPIAALKGKVGTKGNSVLLRKGLVVFQFVISIILIVSVLVIYKQVEFIQNTNLGYNKDQIITFPKEGKLNKDFDPFLTELKRTPGIINASQMSGDLPGWIAFSQGFKWEGMTESDKKLRFYIIRGGYDLIDLLGVDIIEGRNFSKDLVTDKDAIILNETALNMTNLENPIGQKFGNANPNAPTKEIIGVVKNFHFQSLQEEVKPFFFSISENGNKFIVKLAAGREQEAIDQIEKLYSEFNTGYPFEFKFLDDDYQAVYAAEQRISSLSKYFASIAIGISCLGLLALTAFSTQRRFKEIAIRKVLGSNGMEIIRLLSKEYLILISLAIIIAIPLSYQLMRNWLDGFAYRIDLSLNFFILGGILMIAIAGLTIISQTMRSAKVNVTESLRSE